jgi:hypothetical protein
LNRGAGRDLWRTGSSVRIDEKTSKITIIALNGSVNYRGEAYKTLDKKYVSQVRTLASHLVGKVGGVWSCDAATAAKAIATNKA